MCNLTGKQRICRELASQPGPQLQRPRVVLFPDISNRKQDAREGREIVSMFGGGFEVRDSALLIGRQATQAKNPSYGGCHASHDVFAEAGSQQSVVAIGTNCK